jgi:hypothetical protein
MKGSRRQRAAEPARKPELERMVHRRSRASDDSGGPKSSKSPDVDNVLDMIDQRVGQLMIRSGEIEAKIEKLESDAAPALRDPSSSSSASASKPPREPKPQPGSHVEIQETDSKHSGSASAQSSGTVDVSELVRWVMSLQTQIQEIREDQRDISDKIKEIHIHLKQRGRLSD